MSRCDKASQLSTIQPSRYGAQTPDAVFSPSQKLQIALVLAELGVPELEVGILAMGEGLTRLRYPVALFNSINNYFKSRCSLLTLSKQSS